MKKRKNRFSLLPTFLLFCFYGCTTSTHITVNPSSPYLLKENDLILVAEMENISAYNSQQLFAGSLENNVPCNIQYEYSVDHEKNLLQYAIELPDYSSVESPDFSKIKEHTAFDYLLLTKLISTKSGETIYEGNERGYVDHSAEEVTIGFKLFDIHTGLISKDFVITSTRRPIKGSNNKGESYEIPVLASPIGRAIKKGFAKITKESRCE